jgi:carbon storage regulator CsrA
MMLVLSRKKNQKVIILLDEVIKKIAEHTKTRTAAGACLEIIEEELLHDYGNTIEIVVVEIRGDKARLGIQAASMIPVHRQEVYDRIGGEGDK